MIKPYYIRDGIIIYCGDCLEIMPRLEGPFDAIIADLPYGVTDCSWDSTIPLDGLWANYKRFKKNNCPIILFGNEPFTSLLVMSQVKLFRHKWTWEKDKAANFLQAPYMPIANCEDVLVFNDEGYAKSSRNKPTYNPQMEQSAKFQKRNTSNSIKGLSLRRVHQRPNPTPLQSKGNYDGWKRYPKTKIYFPVDRGANRYHPTQKPLALLRYLIRTYTNSGDLILDNTMGSGTTLVAAQIEGRRAVGIDISEEYCQIAVDRLKPPGFLALLEAEQNVSNGKQLALIPEGES